MTDQKAGHSAIRISFILSPFLTESAVSDAQNLIQNNDVRVHETGNGKCQPAFHTTRKLFKFVILKFVQFCKMNDFIIFGIQKIPCIAKQRATQISVFSRLSYLHQIHFPVPKCRYRTICLKRSIGWNHDSGDCL